MLCYQIERLKDSKRKNFAYDGPQTGGYGNQNQEAVSIHSGQQKLHNAFPNTQTVWRRADKAHHPADGIGKNQVKVIRVMLTGSHDDMKRIEAEGKLDQWCADNLAWLNKTFGEDNIVSAVLHLDESTPHIHAAVVPIVTGERRKVKEKRIPDKPGKKKYRKKSPDTVRLCNDDVMSRIKLKEYQDTYAEAMARYGLQRGIDGSVAIFPRRSFTATP